MGFLKLLENLTKRVENLTKRVEPLAQQGREQNIYGRVLTPDERADVEQIMAIQDEELRRKTLELWQSDFRSFGRVPTPGERQEFKRHKEEKKKQEEDDIRTFGRVLNYDEREKVTKELQAKKRIETLIADADLEATTTNRPKPSDPSRNPKPPQWRYPKPPRV